MIVGTKIVITRGGFVRQNNTTSVADATRQEFELHATKGWRLIRTMHGTTTDRRMPAHQAIFLRKHPAPARKSVELSPLQMERARFRHQWGRRAYAQARWEEAKAALVADKSTTT